MIMWLFCVVFRITLHDSLIVGKENLWQSEHKIYLIYGIDFGSLNNYFCSVKMVGSPK